MKNLKASNVLVIPSRMESLPQTIKEAFFLRVPVVATSVGDIPNVIQNNISGILVPPNDPESLLDAVNSLLTQKEKAVKMTSLAYDFIKNNFTWEVLLPKYVEFYEKLSN